MVRSHATRLNKKIVSLGTRVALSTKFAQVWPFLPFSSFFLFLSFFFPLLLAPFSSTPLQGNLEIIEKAAVESHKTRDLVSLLKKNGWNKSVLIIGSDAVTRKLGRAAQNIPGVTVLPHYETNVYDILRHEKLVMSVNAVNFLERLFKNDPSHY